MYRELALACYRQKVNLEDEEKVLEVFNSISIELKQTEDGIKAILNGEDVSDEVFSPTISKLVPVVAAIYRVRKEMVIRQKKMVKNAIDGGKSIVMEGRDITTEVIPDADIKIYLTADVKKERKEDSNNLKREELKLILMMF